ncbi:MAG TPA: glycosyltransferase family 4 protein [Micromonosporaceae bacterium]|nr:glycosyltransferase family 4 protein [Micromonosporaceae bacterium]
MTAARALFVAPYFPPAGGGLERYVRNLATRLHRDAGWQVVVAAAGAAGRGGVERTEAADYILYRLPTSFRVSNTPVGVTWARRLRAIMSAESVDLVNAHAPVPGMADIAAAVAGELPFVLTYHTGPMKKGRWPADAAIWGYEQVLMRRLARRADRVICSSAFVQSAFPRYFFAKSSVIAPGIDPDVFSADPSVTRTGRVLFVVSALGPSARHKGLDDLLRALAMIRRGRPGLGLDIVAVDTRHSTLEDRCRQLGIADIVRVVGHLEGEALASAYRRASVVALPSHNDSAPTVLLEAMACGTPVVAYAVGGVPALVRDGVDGLLTTPGDVDGFAARLALVLDDADLAGRLGRRGCVRVHAEYGWARQAARTAGVFEQAIRSRRAAPRRVAIVAPYFPPRIGGLERYAHRIATAVRDAPDLEPIVITTNHLGRRSRFDHVDGIPTLRLGGAVRLSNTPVNLLWPWRLRRIFRHQRIDIVNAHAPVPYLADVATMVAGRRPVLLTYHAGSMAKGRQPVDVVVRAYERLVLPEILRRAATVVSVSPASLAHGRANSVQVTPGVDVDVFVPAGDVPGGHAAAPAPVLMYVGRMDRTSPWKGVATLLQAFVHVARDVPAAQLVLVGGGDAVAEHRRLVDRLGLRHRVRFAGPLRDDDLVRAYQSAAVVVLPSITGSESFGMCLIEAMACAKPVIGSDVGGIPFVIDHGRTGLLVPPGAPLALATACTRLLRHPDVAARMGREGRREVVARYAWPGQVEKYLGLLRALPSPPTRGG